ncbi:uncharacterized protein stbd1 [Alosa sapidissima]|uniref:uncharacterized protein stbd1 n=1 Tax=Alosa sapidissima TaxID=34773 RepID=UPI001C098C13|nr:uncharacterized protein stbd1 [Alosa sapidissima]
MAVKKSKSVALDSHNLNPLFSMMKGYGPLMALGIIAVLSVCAAFFIYRSTRVQSERNGEKSVTETEEEEETNTIPKKRRMENKHVKFESTGIMDNAQISSRLHSKDQDEGNEASNTYQSSERCGKAQGYRQESVTDHTSVHNGSCASPTSCDGFLDQPEVEAELMDDAAEQRGMQVGSDEDLFVGQDNQQGFITEGQMHATVSESWEDLSGCFEKVCYKMSDLHEKNMSDNSPAQNSSCVVDSAYEDGESETEKSCGAQSCSSSNDFAYYQQSGQDSPTEHLVKDDLLEDKREIEELTWGMQAVDVTSKGLVDMTVHHREQEMPLHRYTHDYLSFSPVGATRLIGESPVTKTADVCPVVQTQTPSARGDVPVEDKTEINIMEATMDNNEWLTGNESRSDCPWLSVSDGGESSSMAEESQQDVEWDTEKSEASEELSAVYTSSDDDDPAMKRVATVPPMLQTVSVTFSVHYITDAPNQLLAVTGELLELGGWQDFVLLQRGKNGFWANTITLPVESQVEWKFVLVEDDKICRWEECSNRHLVLTGHEDDLHVQGWWGCL